MPGIVLAACRSGVHAFSKDVVPEIRLIAGLGVEGDAHNGLTVQHLSRVARDRTQPNLRQVHLIHAELHDELAEKGFAVGPGSLGENITTRGIELLRLPRGTRLRVGPDAVVEVTGLRNPCVQIDRYQPGLLAEVAGRDANGNIVRKTGVMSVVIVGGDVHTGDTISVELPPEPHEPLPVV